MKNFIEINFAGFFLITLIIGLLCITPTTAQESSDAVYVGEFNIRPLLNALYHKESTCGHNKNDGDSGRAIGPYQIWEVYWQDAIEYDPSIGGTYQDCRKKSYAEKVIRAYMERYGKKHLNNKYLAGVHHRLASTKHRNSGDEAYWKDVKYILENGCDCK